MKIRTSHCALGVLFTVALAARPALAAPPLLPEALVRPATISEPTPVTPTSKIFEGRFTLAPPANYIEEEYIISGTAVGLPYRTVMIVERPKDPKAFSGTVVLEQLHGGNMAIAFSMMHDYIWRHGLGYAMVVADRAWIDKWVKPVNPDRYASLDISQLSGPFSPSRYNEVTVMSRDWLTELRQSGRQRPMTFSIMDQAAALFKSSEKGNPFGPGKTRHVILTGGSGTGFETVEYIDMDYPNTHLADGSHPFDGFLPLITPAIQPVPKIDTPVIHVVAQADVTGLHSFPYFYRRDDSDAPNDRYRLYEVAGADHGDKSMALIPQNAAVNNPNNFPLRFVVHAALDNLIKWIDSGTLPPHADRLDDNPANEEMMLDENGNVKGGVRSTYLDVPLSAYHFERVYAADGVGMLGHGTTVPLAADRLTQLYRNHADYVSKVSHRLDELVKGRWILPEDAKFVREEARANVAPWAASH